MIDWLQRWLVRRRRERKLSVKYAKNAMKALDIELRLDRFREETLKEKMRLELAFQKRNGTRSYVV